MTAHNDAVRAAFASQAPAFEDTTRAFADSEVMAWILENSPADANDRLLDVAAGTALVARAMSSRVESVVAMDLTAEMLEVGRRACLAEGQRNVSFVLGDATRLSFADESFDRAVCRLALHHYDDPAPAIAEMLRVCRIGGAITIIDLVAPSEEATTVFNELERLRDPSHTRALTAQQLRRAIEGAGGRIVHEAARENVLSSDKWLDQTATPPEHAAAIHAAWHTELAGGRQTGMAPRQGTGGLIEFAHQWKLYVAAP